MVSIRRNCLSFCKNGPSSGPLVENLWEGERYGRNGGQDDRILCCVPYFLPLLPILRFSSYLQNSLPADDFRVINRGSYTCSINDNTIDVWRQKLSERNNPNSVKYVHCCWFFKHIVGIFLGTDLKVGGAQQCCCPLMGDMHGLNCFL